MIILNIAFCVLFLAATELPDIPSAASGPEVELTGWKKSLQADDKRMKKLSHLNLYCRFLQYYYKAVMQVSQYCIFAGIQYTGELNRNSCLLFRCLSLLFTTVFSRHFASCLCSFSLVTFCDRDAHF